MARTLLLPASMNSIDVHRHVRAALSAADELSRHEHAERADRASETLAALRTTLGGIDLALGRSHRASEELVDQLHALVVKLRRLQQVHDRAHVDQLLDEVGALEKSLRERAVPSGSKRETPPREGEIRCGLLARLGLGLVPHRPLRELAIWRVVGVCVLFAAASVTWLMTAGRARRRRQK